MENVDLGVSYNVGFAAHGLDIYIGREGHDCQKVSVLILEMINCRISTVIWLHLTVPNSFFKLRFENTVFEQISLFTEQQVGFGSFIFDNCTFMEVLCVDIQRFVDFKILRSSINVPNDCDGRDCNVHLTGVDGNDRIMSDSEMRNEILFDMDFNQILVSNEKLSEIFFDRFDTSFFSYSIVDIESSSFHGGQGPFFTVHQARLRLSKTVLHIQSHRTENLIDSQGVFRSKDVLINLTSTDKDLLQVNIMSLLPGHLKKFVECQNTQIICPLGMAAVETVPINRFEPRVYHCEAACTSDMYTFQSGNMILDGHYEHRAEHAMKSFVSNLDNPLCNQCNQLVTAVKMMNLVNPLTPATATGLDLFVGSVKLV